MLYRIFIVSNMVFVAGIFALFAGNYLFPGVAPYAMPVGALVAGVSAIVFGVSGIALIWPNDRT